MRFVFPLLLAALMVGCQPGDDELNAAASAATENPLASDQNATRYIEIESADALRAAIRDTDADIVLVNFWATWCGPCRVEFPDLMRYDAEKEGEGIEVRFVSVDMPADGEFVQDFLDEQGVTEPSFLYTGPGDLIGQFDPEAASIVPTTLVFDREGTLLRSKWGILEYDEIDQFIADAISA
ncbi:MAG: TlpA family protein disulfide reductase [Bacteroidota bacterium]